MALNRGPRRPERRLDGAGSDVSRPVRGLSGHRAAGWREEMNAAGKDEVEDLQRASVVTEIRLPAASRETDAPRTIWDVNQKGNAVM